MPQFKRKPQTITAWQYQPDQPIPVWAARHVHKIGDEYPNNRTAKDWHGIIHGVEPGDYIVKHRDDRVDGIYGPLPANIFEADYAPVAEPQSADKDYLRLAANALKEKLPDQHGFILLVMPFGGDAATNRLNYTSDIQRADAIRVLKGFLFQIGETENWMKHIP